MNEFKIHKIEQQTLQISLYAVGFSVFVALIYGLYIQSHAIILDGIFSSFSFIGTGLNWLTSKLVHRSPNEKFQYGYTHLEPLAQIVNGLMMLIICCYAMINGISALIHKKTSEFGEYGWGYAIFMTFFCLGVWYFEKQQYKKTKSELIKVDAAEWLIDLVFSALILLGFCVAIFTKDRFPELILHIDSILVCVMSLFLAPIPIHILKKNFQQIAGMTGEENQITPKIESILDELLHKEQIADYSTHIIKTGRTYFVEINLLTGKNFSLQTIEQQDELRQKIIQKIDIPLKYIWLSLCITANRKWHD